MREAHGQPAPNKASAPPAAAPEPMVRAHISAPIRTHHLRCCVQCELCKPCSRSESRALALLAICKAVG